MLPPIHFGMEEKEGGKLVKVSCYQTRQMTENELGKFFWDLFPHQSPKNEYKSNGVVWRMKKYGHRKVFSAYQNQVCCKDHHCVLLQIPFQFILVVAVLWYPASMLHHRGLHSSVLAEEFMDCRDKRQKDSRKWQKGRINLVVPSDLHGLLSASSYPMQSADAHTWMHTVSLPLPCSWLCHATCAHTTGRYSLFLGFLEGGEWGMEKEVAVWIQGHRSSVRQLPHNDCLTVPSPGQGRLLVTD